MKFIVPGKGMVIMFDRPEKMDESYRYPDETIVKKGDMLVAFGHVWE